MTETWGSYEIEKLIARGGMAEVYLAQIKSVGNFSRPVCIKVMREEYADDGEFVSMFETEAKVCARLQHPNIVQVYDFDHVAGRHFIVMEYVKGLDLRAILKSSQKLGMRVALEFSIYAMEAILHALRYAHTCQVDGHSFTVIHRDVSPHNVLLSEDGIVKLADFGIAKVKALTPDTGAGVVKGKKRYLAPEQLRGEDVGPQTDLYSCGVLFFELLTSRRLFSSNDDGELTDQILRGRPKPLHGYSSGINDLLAALLEPNRHDRIQSAQEALGLLRGLDVPSCGSDRAAQLVKAHLGLGMESANVILGGENAPPVVSSPDAETRKMPAGSVSK